MTLKLKIKNVKFWNEMLNAFTSACRENKTKTKTPSESTFPVLQLLLLCKIFSGQSLIEKNG